MRRSSKVSMLRKTDIFKLEADKAEKIYVDGEFKRV
jgi:hypothetical protein